MSQVPAKFRLLKIHVQESSFKQSASYGDTMDVKIKPSAVLNEADNTFELSLYVRVTDADSRFEAYVHQIGLFQFSEGIQLEELSSYFLINAPALLFPYVRSYISALTALSGYETIMLPALNLSNLKEDLQANITKV